MSGWKYLGAALGGVGGFLVGGPAGAVAGGSAGYGVGASADAANESSDAVANAQAAANGVTTPQIDPNAGVGGGWGGMTGSEQSMVAADASGYNDVSAPYLAQKQKYAELLRAYQANPTPENAAATRAASDEVDRLGSALNAQVKDAQARAPDMSDPARFSAHGQASYARMAPQVSMVSPDMANYSADRSMFAGGGQDLSGSLLKMQTDPVASGQGQQQLVDRLNSDMAGGAPSLAQAQLAQTTGQNLAAQRSMVASAGPMDYGATARAAVMAGANTQQQAIQQAAALRAQEYAQARGELGGALTNQRGQTLQNSGLQNDVMVQKRAQELQAMGLDAQSALQRAQLESQQNLNNANLQAGQNQLNQGREMGYLGAYQDARHMQQGNQQFNATSALEAQRIKAGLQGTAIQAQQADASSQRQMAGSMIGAGASMGASYMQSHPSAPETKDYYDPENPGF